MSHLSNTTTKSSISPLKWSEEYRHKLITPDDVEAWRARQSQTVATLNGSFDLLHAGHLQIIFEASQQADILLVALNTDSSIQRYKSADRPIIPLEQRLQMMAALEFVDYVTYFDEPDPIDFLKKAKPDIHVNGAEYGANCVERDYVKQLHIVQLVPGLSTSNLIKKLCDS